MVSTMLALVFCVLLSSSTLGQVPDLGIDIPVDYEQHIGSAQNVGTGAVDFIYVEGYEPFAVMVVNAASPVDSVVLDYSSMKKELTITATDAKATNNVIILVNKAFVDEFIGTQEKTNFTVSDAVNYEGLDNKYKDIEGAGSGIEGGYYVFKITGFSSQTITVSSTSLATPQNIMIISLIAIIIVGVVIFYNKSKK